MGNDRNRHLLPHIPVIQKEVKPVQWAVEATEPVPAEETNPQN